MTYLMIGLLIGSFGTAMAYYEKQPTFWCICVGAFATFFYPFLIACALVAGLMSICDWIDHKRGMKP